MSELLTLAEASRLLGVDSAEVIRLIYGEEIEAVVVDGQLRVPADQERLGESTPARTGADPPSGIASSPRAPFRP